VYLKSLQIQGFKSFPDKITIHFGKGLTAIVGPNGSGKSNISDAIRWVLGEQSFKSLRGTKMEDVVFSGTQKRRPMGAAEVSLTIDNTSRFVRFDCDEVTVTRRYFRSGESEFLVNKKPVRLKDIHEMFMDTGLGRDGYSVIGQGRIDEVLSKKSEDRRELFEEAAGITKYRYKKDEAERKLAAAGENLARVSDIIEELSAQLGPMEKRAARAKEYLKIRDELKGLEVGIWGRQLQALKKAAEKAEVDLKIGLFMLEEARSGLDKLYEEGQALQNAAGQATIAAEKARSARDTAEANRSKEESEQAVLSVSIQHHETRIQGLMATGAKREERILELDRQKKERENLLSDKTKRHGQLSDELDALTKKALEAATHLEDLEAKAEGLAAMAALARQNASEAKARAQAAQDATVETKSRLEEGSEAAQKAAERLAQEKAEQEALAKQIDKAQEELQAAKNIVSGYGLRLQSAEKKAEAAQNEEYRLLVEENALVSKVSMLSELAREYEGYSAAVKSVMKLSKAGRLPGVLGTVGELVHAENHVALAIETALGAALQNIVTNTEETARDAISYLKERNIGRATFLPISAVRGNVLSEQGLENEAGFVGVAVELCSFPQETKGVFASLLGRTVIVERMNDAIALARKRGHRFRIVTLDGQVINAGGSMTGGAAGRQTGILTRANELKEASAKLAKLRAEKQKHGQILAEANRLLTAAKYEKEQAEAELRAAEDTLLSLKTAAAQHAFLLENLQKQEEEFSKARENTELALQHLAAEEESWLARAEASEQEAQAKEAELAGLTKGKADAEGEHQAMAEQLTALRSALAANEAEQEGIRQAIIELERQRNEADSDQATLEAEQKEAIRQKALLEERRELCKQRAEQFALTAAAQAEALSAALAEREALEQKKTECDKALRDANERLVALEREQSRLESALQTVKNEEKQLSARLWEQYELTPGEALAAPEPEDEKAALARISELRSRQKALGPVDVGAIDEFAALKERYDYLTSQKEDIEESAQGLRSLIAELTDTMKTLFIQSFAAISESFSQTFAEIFGGGTAELSLTDLEEPLTSGIEIKAQPPGKNLKSITLLSGGEKALVAIALYFALLKVQPAPFCVLDEIDAALDDVNVLRFVTYLRRLSAEIQFIVVTHRRTTMERADILYGVTMQEQGVSRLLSLDLAGMEKQFTLT
jgi:chromosome segregation protein